jgi:hypothetical protein
MQMRTILSVAIILASIAWLNSCASDECKVLADPHAVAQCQLESNMPG